MWSDWGKRELFIIVKAAVDKLRHAEAAWKLLGSSFEAALDFTVGLSAKRRLHQAHFGSGSIPVVCLARNCLLVFLNGSSNVHLAALFGCFHYHHAQMVHIAPSDGRILTISASGHYMTSGAKKTACVYQFFLL